MGEEYSPLVSLTKDFIRPFLGYQSTEIAMKFPPLLPTIALSAALASPASAQAATVYAKVVGVDPIYASGDARQVCVPYQAVHPYSEPYRGSTAYRQPYQRLYEPHNRYSSGDSVAGTLAGAAIGGVVGNQVGDGRGQIAATVAGAVIGGIVGGELQRQNSDSYRLYDPAPVDYHSGWERVEHPRNDYRGQANQFGRGQYCTMEYNHRTQVLGYDVTYLYRGQYFISRMSHAPAIGSHMEIAIPGW